MRQTRLRTLCECAMMLALSIALSYVVLGIKLPLGGKVTLFSMLPVCLISIRHGLRWGLPLAFLFSLFQLFDSLGEVLSWGLTPGMLIVSCLLDYILAYSVIGLCGLTRRYDRIGCICGIAAVCFLRFGVHFLSGVVLWTKYDEFVVFGETFFNRPFLYSFLYNGMFMLPETLLTVVGAALLLGPSRTYQTIVQRGKASNA